MTGPAVTHRLRVLWQWFLGTTPSRCHDCGRYAWWGDSTVRGPDRSWCQRCSRQA